MEYIIEKCTEGDADYIIDRLVEYNLSQMPAGQEVLFDTLDKKITDDTRLLAEIEKTAKEKGCYLIHLDTFDFQAKEFYEKQDYAVFGILEDCPKGHYRYYLKKVISAL